MAASVQVLCPNGRRQNVKITPNTKLLQVLEEVCKRQGFVPPEDYVLMHGRNQVDLSLSVRFAGLSNNAKLELIKSSTSRQEEDVIIALQLDTGKRVQGSFAPTLALWDILMHLEDNNSECKGELIKSTGSQEHLQPVCIYMQEQVVGESALKATTLKKLGLTSGRAVIRFLHRPIEDDVMASICKKVEKDKAKEIRLEEIAGKRQLKNKNISKSEIQESTSSSQTSSVKDVTPSESAPTESQEESQKGAQTVVSEMEISTQNPESESSESREESMEEDTVTSAQSKPELMPNTNASEYSTTSSASSQRAVQSSAINDLRNLNIPGLEIFTPDDFNDLTPQEQALAQRLASRFLPHLQAAAMPPVPSVDSSGQNSQQLPASESNFANFKFPEETKGKNLSSGKYESSRTENSKPCDRQTAVYRARDGSDASQDPQDEELPEEFFEVTQADVRKMYRDLQKAVQDLEEQPLLTNTMREINRRAICDKYEQVVIRVHFPDKLVLQAFFRPMETVKSLHTFVRNNLQDKKLKFYLYTTPPRKILEDMNSTLVSNNLYPAALVYFGSEDVRDNYLEESLREQTVSRLEAESVVSKLRNSNMEKTESSNSTPESQPGPSGMQRRPANAARSSSSSSTSGAASTGVPKWLKLGKK